MKGKMIRQKGFSKMLRENLKHHKNERLNKLSDNDIDEFITEFWSVLAYAIRKGLYVSFEGWISFFTKPVQRRCHNPHTSEAWMSYKKRIRTNILGSFREEAEITLTPEEFHQHQQEVLEKKKKN